MKDLQIFEPSTLLFCDVRLGDTGIIVSKCEKVPFFSKTHERYWAHKLGVDILIGLCCPLLWCSIILLCSFHFFATIVYITFSIISINDMVMGEVFS